MEIVAYAYVAPDEPTLSSSGTTSDTATDTATEPEGGTIIMQIKLYVFVGGELTATDGS
jgi:hypothetical protein